MTSKLNSVLASIVRITIGTIFSNIKLTVSSSSFRKISVLKLFVLTNVVTIVTFIARITIICRSCRNIGNVSGNRIRRNCCVLSTFTVSVSLSILCGTRPKLIIMLCISGSKVQSISVTSVGATLAFVTLSPFSYGKVAISVVSGVTNRLKSVIEGMARTIPSREKTVFR